MHTTFLFGSLLAAILFATSGLALARTNDDADASANPNRVEGTHPTGMTGTYRGWSQNRGSGAGAKNFVGNDHQPGNGGNRWSSNQNGDNR